MPDQRQLRPCIVDGCGTPAWSRGWCRIHYERWRKHGDPLAGYRGRPLDPRHDAAVRLYEKCLQMVNGCIEFTGARSAFGYGTIRTMRGMGHGNVSAHVLAWVIRNGPIPKHLLLRHVCDNPACVNVSHLLLGTQKDNIEDMWKRGRQSGQFRQTAYCKRGHPWTKENTGLQRTGRFCRTCSALNRRAKRLRRETNPTTEARLQP